MAQEVVLGIDIGGTFTKFGLVDRSGKIYFEDEISSREHGTIEQFIEAFHQHLFNRLEQLEISFQIVGIGVGAPNGNYYSGCIETRCPTRP